MSDPSALAGLVQALPSDVSDLAAVIQGLLVHSSWLNHYGVDEPTSEAVDRMTLPVADRLREKGVRGPESEGAQRIATPSETCRHPPRS